MQIQSKNIKRQAIVTHEFRVVRSCSEENVQYLNYLLEKEAWDLVYSQTSANDAYNEFLGSFQYYYDIVMPKKRVKIKKLKNKWITSGIRASSIKLRFLNRLVKEANIPEFKKYYCRYNKTYNKVISETKRITNDMRINTSGNKSKVMWDLIKEELRNQKKEIRNIELNVNGAKIQDPKVIANVFNDYYTSIAHNILSSNLLPRNSEVSANTVNYNSSSTFLTPTTEVEVGGIIKGLDNKRTTGVDISEYIIKKCYPKIITVLTYIINLSLATGYFPDQLKITKEKPLYKKGPDTDVGNLDQFL